MSNHKPFALVFGRADEPELAVLSGSSYVYTNGDIAKIDEGSLDGFQTIFMEQAGLEKYVANAFYRKADNHTQAVPKIPTPRMLSVFNGCQPEDLDSAYKAMLMLANITLMEEQAQPQEWIDAGGLWVECMRYLEQMVSRVEFGQRLKVLMVMQSAWCDVALRSIDSAHIAGIYDGALQQVLGAQKQITQTKH